MPSLNRRKLRKLILQEIRRLNEDPIGDAQEDIPVDIEAIAKEYIAKGFKLDGEAYEPVQGGGTIAQYTKEVEGPANEVNQYKLTLKIEYKQ